MHRDRENPDRTADGGSTRFSHNPGTGRNEPKRHEKKQQRDDWLPRQGGDQTRTGKPEDGRRGSGS